MPGPRRGRGPATRQVHAGALTRPRAWSTCVTRPCARATRSVRLLLNTTAAVTPSEGEETLKSVAGGLISVDPRRCPAGLPVGTPGGAQARLPRVLLRVEAASRPPGLPSPPGEFPCSAPCPPGPADPAVLRLDPAQPCPPQPNAAQAWGAWSRGGVDPAPLACPCPWAAGPQARVCLAPTCRTWSGLSSRENWLCALCSAHCPGTQSPGSEAGGLGLCAGTGHGCWPGFGGPGGSSASSLLGVTWGGLDRLASPCPWGRLTAPVLVHPP